MITISNDRGDVTVARQNGGQRLIEVSRAVSAKKTVRLVLDEALAVKVADALVDIAESE